MKVNAGTGAGRGAGTTTIDATRPTVAPFVLSRTCTALFAAIVSPSTVTSPELIAGVPAVITLGTVTPSVYVIAPIVSVPLIADNVSPSANASVKSTVKTSLLVAARVQTCSHV